MEYEVLIVKYGTEETVEVMGPMSLRRAERVDDGANINLDHENFYTKIVEVGTIHSVPTVPGN